MYELSFVEVYFEVKRPDFHGIIFAMQRIKSV